MVRRTLVRRSISASRFTTSAASNDLYPHGAASCYTTCLPLPLDIADQDTRFGAAFRILGAGVAGTPFPAASVAFLHRGTLIALRAFGHHTYPPGSLPVTPETFFDLASVSKVVATPTAA